MRYAPALAVVVLLALVGGGARAQTEGAPEDHIRRGIELRREHRNAEALAEFEAADALAPSPRAKAQAALAQLALGRWVEAESGLVEALGAGEDAWIARNHDALAEALESVRRHVGDLLVDANVPGAEVWIDGARRGALPQTTALRVAAGIVVVEVRATGYVTVQRTAEVLGGGAARETFALTAISEAAPAGETPVAGPLAPLPAATQETSGRRTGGWLAIGAAGVALGIGAVATGVSYSEASIYNDDSRCLVGTATRDAQCGSHRTSSMTARTIAITSFTVGGVAGATGVTLLLTAPRRPAQVACGIGLGGVACGGAFSASERSASSHGARAPNCHPVG